MEQDKIEPGDTVICSKHEDWGPVTCSTITNAGGICFIYKGEFGKMANREYDIVHISTLTLHSKSTKYNN